MRQNKVTKCICHNRSFREVKTYAEKHDLTTVDELQDHDYCSNGCGLCGPYVAETLKSDQVEFYPGEPFRKKRKS